MSTHSTAEVKPTFLFLGIYLSTQQSFFSQTTLQTETNHVMKSPTEMALC